MTLEERMSPDVLKEYRDERIVVRWEPAYCIHAAKCLDAVPEVFDVTRRPWILVQGATADRIADAVMQCPTGALHVERLDGGDQEPVPERTTVEPQRNGPLYLRGNMKFVGATGNVTREDTRAALCRCGGSSNTPFCDGTHRKTGFRAP
jgi:uncharacterized Fe-S cluster protein YjdI